MFAEQDGDEQFMRLALALAAGQLGRTGINPAVGCVIVKDGVIIGQGATADGGRPHAEAVALLEAGQAAWGATVYVTLEPCAHISPRGGSCVEALLEAGVARVVACLEDPDPRTAGTSFELLRAAGVTVDVGLLAQEGGQQIADFTARITGT